MEKIVWFVREVGAERPLIVSDRFSPYEVFSSRETAEARLKAELELSPNRKFEVLAANLNWIDSLPSK